MSNEKILLIYNPNAGKASIRDKLSDVISALTETGKELTVFPTRAPGDAYDRLRRLDPDYSVVAIAGGDGTLSESVRGIMRLPRDARPMLGYIPCGTTNDFASAIGVSRDIVTAAADIVRGEAFFCDIGSFCGLTFNYVAAFGAFTDVAYDTPQHYKNTLGHTAYVLEGISRISQIKPIRMKINRDGDVIEDDFIFGMITNGTTVGGVIQTGSDVSLCDGLFEMLLIKMPVSLPELREIIRAIIQKDLASEMFISSKLSEITFEAPYDVKWTLDGEYGGSHKTAAIKNEHDAVKFIVPKK